VRGNMDKVNTKYIGIKEILSGVNKPLTADCIKINYKGIEVSVYGILHAITGGTNREYRDFVNNTIKSAEGVNLAEKSMKAMYKGLDVEVEDWLQIKPKDAFLFSLMSFLKPMFLITIIKTLVSEKITKFSGFGLNGVNVPNNLSGDPRFHLLSPLDRRILAGFPLPEQYFNLNLMRRSKLQKEKINFADHNWEWLTYVEPYGNIPMRSIHMIEYSVQYAIKNNINSVNLFVGEIHNSDIEWFVENKKKHTLPKEIEIVSQKIEFEVTDLLKGKNKYKYTYYLLSLMAGSLSAISVYLFVIIMFMAYAQYR